MWIWLFRTKLRTIDLDQNYFPIANSIRKIIAFSGRAFGETIMLNILISETPICKKSEVFYVSLEKAS